VTDNDPHRLPRVAVPRHYDLALAPDLDAGTFTGTVTIALEVVEETRSLWCNAVDLTITAAALEREGEHLPLGVTVDEAGERLRLDATTPIAGGPARLHLAFSGALIEQLRGFYRSSFSAADGTRRTIATTQFEATDARRAFPCWDEPEYKASFAVTLDVADGLLAVSNGPVVDETDLGDGRRRVRFAPTMVMSTYLVAFVIGPLEATAPVDVDGVPLRVVHTPGNAHLTAFALESAAFALRWFRDYYGIPYPAEKLDLVAIPDFAFGAMENLGCVTFRETLLLVDPADVPQPELQRVADVIHHELAHMWFGDLVTMRWWNGIWLNEAFATFMEMKCTDAFRPEWKRWNDFGISRSAAMDVDSLDATRPIEYPVHSPADAEGMFDLLTYEKGAAVVRMLEQYVGEDAFRDGIRAYLQRHAYGSTETHDLWDAIEETTGAPVRQMMDTWIFQGGHPVVRVGGTLDGATRLTQQRFSYLSAAEQQWIVPLRVRAGGDEHRVLLERGPVTLPVRADTVESANVAGSGFYRVRLSDTALARIASEGAPTDDAIERYGIVDDAWALTLAGELRAEQFLALTEGFRRDPDLSVWQRIIGALDGISRAVDPATPDLLDERLHVLFAPMRAHLGGTPRPDEPARTAELRAALLEADALLAHDTDAVAQAHQLHAAGGAHPALAAAAVRVVAAHGDATRYDEYLAAMRGAATPQEAERYRSALALFPGEAEMRRTLAACLDGTIRSQDAPFVLRSALRNRHQGAFVWTSVTEQWDTLRSVIPTMLVARLLEGISALAEPGLAERVEGFLAAHDVPQGRTVIAQHRERLRVHAAFRSRERPALATLVNP
jgi:puromycin-sensitive aminopeptidase